MKKLSYRKMKNLFNPVTGGVEPIKKKKRVRQGDLCGWKSV